MKEIPGNIQAAIKMVARRDWEVYFDSCIVAKQAQIEGTADQNLPLLKAEIKALREVKNSFLSVQ